MSGQDAPCLRFLAFLRGGEAVAVGEVGGRDVLCLVGMGPRGVGEDTEGARGRRQCSGRPRQGRRRTGDGDGANIEEMIDVVYHSDHPGTG